MTRIGRLFAVVVGATAISMSVVSTAGAAAPGSSVRLEGHCEYCAVGGSHHAPGPHQGDHRQGRDESNGADRGDRAEHTHMSGADRDHGDG